MGGHGRTWTWIGAIAAFVILGYSAAITAYEDPAQAGGSTAPAVLYERTDHCQEPCHLAAAPDTFSVTADVEQLHFVVYAVLEPSSGPAYVSVTDPSGDVRYERLFMDEARHAGAIEDTATWPAELGVWTLTRSYVGVTGMLDFQAWGEGAS